MGDKRTTKFRTILASVACLGMVLLTVFSSMKVQGQVNGTNQEMAPEKAEDISPLLIGESIPVAILKDASGNTFDLNKAVASKPTVLIFYRGGWCPFCSRQLAGIQEIVPDLEKTGYQIIAVSTDSPDGLQKSATSEHLSYTLLSDADMELSKKFGLAFKAPEGYWKMLDKTTGGMDKDKLIPVPSVFIIDTKGAIQFEYINPNFKKRISPALLKTVAETLYKEL